MDFKINDKDVKLNFGVKFVAELDEREMYSSEGIEFGMGLILTKEKLAMGKFDALANVIECALHRESVTIDEVYEAIDEYGEENDLEVLFKKIEEELKNSNAVRATTARMEAASKEANRKQGIQAVKPTSK